MEIKKEQLNEGKRVFSEQISNNLKNIIEYRFNYLIWKNSISAKTKFLTLIVVKLLVHHKPYEEFRNMAKTHAYNALPTGNLCLCYKLIIPHCKQELWVTGAYINK